MKIIYCIPIISTTGGVERVTAIKANWLAQHGYEVHIISKETARNTFYRYDEKVQIHYIGSLYPLENNQDCSLSTTKLPPIAPSTSCQTSPTGGGGK